MNPESAPLMTRVEVLSVLTMMAAFRERTPSETDLRWWRDALAGHSAAECQAAVLAHSKSSPNTITPADITRRIREARQRTEVRRQREQRGDPRAEHQRAAAAARRGMAAVYAAAGWSRRPDQAAALSVPCPVPGCESPAEVICAPVNQPERRHAGTRVHPSRMAAAQRAAAEHVEGVSA